jgi:hypothetical protein
VIEIVAYDPAWPERFAALGGAMRGPLGGVALRIDHEEHSRPAVCFSLVSAGAAPA